MEHGVGILFRIVGHPADAPLPVGSTCAGKANPVEVWNLYVFQLHRRFARDVDLAGEWQANVRTCQAAVPKRR